MPDHHQLASEYAHKLCAELERLGLQKPPGEVVAGAIADSVASKVVVFIVPYDGPPQLWLAPGVCLGNLIGVKGGPAVPITQVFPELREAEKNALEAAPGPDMAPITIKKLAQKAGYGYNWHFRQCVNRLVEWGLLTRTSAGVRRTPGARASAF
jgi:hypothetical protein